MAMFFLLGSYNRNIMTPFPIQITLLISRRYRILTMQNSIGKLMERIVARKLSRDLEDRNILPANQGGFRPGKCTWENAAAYVYEGF